MTIGLLNVDSHNFPNLALMKISAWHKSKGDKVKFVDIFSSYDIVYQSKVFTFTPDYLYEIDCNEIVKGGSGYDLKNRLSYEIENIYPDYSIYNEKRAIGFLTRGCPRGCNFCIVSEKDGKRSEKVADLNSFWKGQKEIVLMDSNILACRDLFKLFDQLIKSRAQIEFSQGLDIRLINEEIIYKLRQIRIKRVHFAWDRKKDEMIVIQKMKLIKKNMKVIKEKFIVYVLVNFDTDFEYDLFRIYQIRDLGYSPYVMIYNKQTSENKYRKLQRWVNNNFIFRSVNKYENYVHGRV